MFASRWVYVPGDRKKLNLNPIETQRQSLLNASNVTGRYELPNPQSISEPTYIEIWASAILEGGPNKE